MTETYFDWDCVREGCGHDEADHVTHLGPLNDSDEQWGVTVIRDVYGGKGRCLAYVPGTAGIGIVNIDGQPHSQCSCQLYSPKGRFPVLEDEPTASDPPLASRQ